MNNKFATIISGIILIAIVAVIIFTPAWNYDQARFLLTLGLAIDSLALISAIIRWIKYGEVMVFKQPGDYET